MDNRLPHSPDHSGKPKDLQRILSDAIQCGFDRKEEQAKALICSVLRQLDSDASGGAIQDAFNNGVEIVRLRHQGNDFKLTMNVERTRAMQTHAVVLTLFEGVSGQSAINLSRTDKFDEVAVQVRIVLSQFSGGIESMKAMIDPVIANFKNS